MWEGQPLTIGAAVEAGAVQQPYAHGAAVSLSHCPVCDLWLEPHQTCLHITERRARGPFAVARIAAAGPVSTRFHEAQHG
jgi:hypothetical protein